MNSGISIGKGILWVLVWLGFMFIYTVLDIVIWRKWTKTLRWRKTKNINSKGYFERCTYYTA